MRIIFHIGDRKTGTTSFQNVLAAWDASGGAARHSVLYPHAGRASVNHVNLYFETVSDPRYKPSRGGWAELSREVSQSDAKMAVISCEGFESAMPAQLKANIDQHLPGHDIEVLSYIRPHMDRLRASYAQNTKTGKYFHDLETFAMRGAQGRLGRRAKRLLAWRKVFDDAFQLRIYDRARLRNGDILSDLFEDVMGLDAATFAALPRPAEDNVTPGANTIELIRRLCAGLPLDQMPNEDFARQFRTHLEAVVLHRLRNELMAINPNDPPLRYSPDLAQSIYDIVLPDARAIDAAFFAGDAPLETALEKSLAIAQRPQAEPTTIDTSVHDAYAEAMAQMMAKLLRMANRDAV